MNRLLDRHSLAAVLLVIVCSHRLAAQGAMTVSGHVQSGGTPLQGAHVRIGALRIDRTTNPAGYYSFVLPGSAVRGQNVDITASLSERRAQYAPKTVAIALTGGSIVQDFDLAPA